METVLITGASGGIGTALVDYMLGHGTYKIVCQYRSGEDNLKRVFQKHDLPFDDYCFKTELTNELQVGTLHDSIKKRHGSLWGLINLAGASSNSMSWKLSVDEFRQVIDANLLTTFITCKEFIPELRERLGGRIINVSSIVASSGIAGASHYCAAKAGIAGFTRSIALELANKGITANTLSLGYFEYGLIDHVPTQMQEDLKARTPMKRFGKASEIGAMLHFLLNKEGEFTTGQDFHINGGLYL